MFVLLWSTVCWILRIQMLLEPKSPNCNLRGAFDPCGTCICESGYYGDKCECDAGWIDDQETALLACTASDSSAICSGRGECVCGDCLCFSLSSNITERYTGRYCECDDYSCPYSDNKMCGGNGVCSCGKCQCFVGYMGNACEISPPDDDRRKSTVGPESADNHENPCVVASSCEQCFDTSPTCGWYKTQILPPDIKSHCNLFDNHLAAGLSQDDILTSETTTFVMIVEPASRTCNSRGSLDTCGQCKCDPDYYGKLCECDAGYGMTSETEIISCSNPRLTDATPCSGRGECICGMCSCFPRNAGSAQYYSGPYCDCDDYSCPYHNNLMCGGNGQCICGECMCSIGYTGESCGCPTSGDTCMATSGQICNGQGKCVCGQCICEGTFKGPTCEECPTCPGRCSLCKDCVLCRAFGSGPCTDECVQCPFDNIMLVDSLNKDGETRDEKSNLCHFIDDADDTHFYFTYMYDTNGLQIEVQRVKEAH